MCIKGTRGRVAIDTSDRHSTDIIDTRSTCWSSVDRYMDDTRSTRVDSYMDDTRSTRVDSRSSGD